ncbi:MAG: hypothetical protein ACLT2T_06290 [Bilophila wadsworthia]
MPPAMSAEVRICPSAWLLTSMLLAAARNRARSASQGPRSREPGHPGQLAHDPRQRHVPAPRLH